MFTDTFLENLLTDILTYFDRVYLLSDPAMLASIDENVTTGSVGTIIGSYVAASWSTVSSKSSHTLNSAASNPFNWSVAAGQEPNRIAIVNSANSLIMSIISTTKGEYANDDAYYLRQITESIGEV